jgi:hypothetical protein
MNAQTFFQYMTVTNTIVFFMLWHRIAKYRLQQLAMARVIDSMNGYIESQRALISELMLAQFQKVESESIKMKKDHNL